MLNREKLVYTYEHRQAVNYVAGRLLDTHKYLQMYDRIHFHDLDKSLLNTLVPDTKLVSMYHKLTNPHHMQKSNIHAHEVSYDDMLEAIIDYESAGYTKADKPLNAYDTVCTATFLSDETRERLLGVLKDLGIDSSYRNTPEDSDWVEYKKTLVPATRTITLGDIEDLISGSIDVVGREIFCYAHAVKDNPLRTLMRKYEIKEFSTEEFTKALQKEVAQIENGR